MDYGFKSLGFVELDYQAQISLFDIACDLQRVEARIERMSSKIDKLESNYWKKVEE